MKRILLGALLLCSVGAQASFSSRVQTARTKIHENRGTVGLVVGSVGTAVVGYVLREPIEMYIEPLVKKACSKVSAFFRWAFRIKR